MRIVDISREASEEEYGRGRMDDLIEQLCSISRCFRNAVMNSVALWTKITNEYIRRKDFADHIARTETAPLAIEFDASPYPEWEEELSMILPYKDRWQTFCGEFVMPTEDVAREFPDIESPAAGTATFCLLFEDDSDELFAVWKFPKLVTLKLINTVPRRGCFVDIVSLEILPLYVSEGDEFIKKIPTFLGQLRRFENLIVDLSNLFGFSMDTDAIQVVELRTVKNFTLRNFHQDAGRDKCLAEYENIAEWAISFSMAGVIECLQTVTSLSIIVSCLEDQYTMGFSLNRFQNIEALEVDATGFCSILHEMPDPVHPTRFRTFVLKENEDLPSNWKDVLYKLTPDVDSLTVAVKQTSVRRDSSWIVVTLTSTRNSYACCRRS